MSHSSSARLRVLITGVSGFVGRQLATRFLDQGHSVIGVDLQINGLDFASHPNFTAIAADLTNTNAASELPWDDIDLLYHLAAAGVKAATRHWPLCVQVNVIGTAALIGELLQRVKDGLSVPRIVYTKSYYEDHLDAIPAFKDNAYVVSKVAATKWLETIAPIYPQPICIAKVYQVYGPGDDPNNVLSYAARQMKAGEVATFGSCEGLRDWIYIDDFIDGLIVCGNWKPSGMTQVDLGSKKMSSLRYILELMANKQGIAKEMLVFDESKDRGDSILNDVAKRWPSNWKPKTSLDLGISKMLGL